MKSKLNTIKKSIPKKNIKEIEVTLIWMAIRYAANRQTIASSMLPADIIQEYYPRLTNIVKDLIYQDLKDNLLKYNEGAFGDSKIDRPNWIKFMECMNYNSHYTIKAKNKKKYVVFEANGRIYPLKSYIKYPYKEIDIPKENILEGLKNE